MQPGCAAVRKLLALDTIEMGMKKRHPKIQHCGKHEMRSK